MVAEALMGVPPAEEETLMETVCPSGTPEVVPEMVTAPSSAALRSPSPPSVSYTHLTLPTKRIV